MMSQQLRMFNDETSFFKYFFSNITYCWQAHKSIYQIAPIGLIGSSDQIDQFEDI